jgi:hypothetical protein
MTCGRYSTAAARREWSLAGVFSIGSAVREYFPKTGFTLAFSRQGEALSAIKGDIIKGAVFSEDGGKKPVGYRQARKSPKYAFSGFSICFGEGIIL